MIMSISLGIEFCKPRYAKDCWMVQFRNHTNLTATGLVPGANYTKILVTLDFLEILTCKGLAHRQSLESGANC